MIVFIALIVVTMKFVWPKIIDAMEERSRKIAAGLAAAEKGKADLVQADQRAEAIVKEARAKAAQILDQAGKRSNEMVDEAKGTTMVYFVKMLAGNGMTRKDVDFIYAGATAARFAALESGASAAAMITAPQLFRAQADGFVNLGYDTQYAPDVPFTADLVNRAWAAQNKATAKKYLAAYSKAIQWFYDEKNRAEAIDILLKVTKMNADDIANATLAANSFTPDTMDQAANIAPQISQLPKT